MGKGFFQVPSAIYEPVKCFSPGSPERETVLQQYQSYYIVKVTVPLYIGSEEVHTDDTRDMSPPHEHQHIVGQYHLAQKKTCCASHSLGFGGQNKMGNP